MGNRLRPTGLDNDTAGPTRSKPIPDGNMLPKDIKRYRSYDNADTVYGETRDISAKVERDAKNYRR
jgi:hypothetical protein